MPTGPGPEGLLDLIRRIYGLADKGLESLSGAEREPGLAEQAAGTAVEKGYHAAAEYLPDRESSTSLGDTISRVYGQEASLAPDYSALASRRPAAIPATPSDEDQAKEYGDRRPGFLDFLKSPEQQSRDQIARTMFGNDLNVHADVTPGLRASAANTDNPVANVATKARRLGTQAVAGTVEQMGAAARDLARTGAVMSGIPIPVADAAIGKNFDPDHEGVVGEAVHKVQEAAGEPRGVLEHVARVLGPQVVVSPTRKLVDLGVEGLNAAQIRRILGGDYAVVSAANPGGQAAEAAANEAAMRQMEALLRGSGYQPIRSVGRYLDHTSGQALEEPSFLVPGLGDQDAVELGRVFGQNSVLTRRGLINLGDRTVHPARGVKFGANPEGETEAVLRGRPTRFSVDLDFDQRLPLDQEPVPAGVPGAQPGGEQLKRPLAAMLGDERGAAGVADQARGLTPALKVYGYGKPKVFTGSDHGVAYMHAEDAIGELPEETTAGFVDKTGRFYDREEVADLLRGKLPSGFQGSLTSEEVQAIGRGASKSELREGRKMAAAGRSVTQYYRMLGDQRGAAGVPNPVETENGLLVQPRMTTDRLNRMMVDDRLPQDRRDFALETLLQRSIAKAKNERGGLGSGGYFDDDVQLSPEAEARYQRDLAAWQATQGLKNGRPIPAPFREDYAESRLGGPIYHDFGPVGSREESIQADAQLERDWLGERGALGADNAFGHLRLEDLHPAVRESLFGKLMLSGDDPWDMTPGELNAARRLHEAMGGEPPQADAWSALMEHAKEMQRITRGAAGNEPGSLGITMLGGAGGAAAGGLTGATADKDHPVIGGILGAVAGMGLGMAAGRGVELAASRLGMARLRKGFLEELGPDPRTGETISAREMVARQRAIPQTAAIQTPERQAMRQSWVQQLDQARGWSPKALEQKLPSGRTRAQAIAQQPEPPPGHQRTLWVLLGYPASGKSRLVDQIFDQAPWARVVDPDEAKAIIPEFAGGTGVAAVHEESSDIVKALRSKWAREGRDIIWPTLGNDKTVAQVEQLERRGYNVQVRLAGDDPVMAAQRDIDRWRRTGRLVDPELIFGGNPKAAYAKLLKSRSVAGEISVDEQGKIGNVVGQAARSGNGGVYAQAAAGGPAGRNGLAGGAAGATGRLANGAAPDVGGGVRGVPGQAVSEGGARGVAGGRSGALGVRYDEPRSIEAEPEAPAQPEGTGANKFVTLWKAGLLTNPATHLANITSNAATAALETAKDVPAAMLDRVLAVGTGMRTKSANIARSAAASLKGARQGITEARRVLRGLSPDEMSKWDNSAETTFHNPILNAYTKGVFRSLSAEDRVFRGMAVRRSIEEQARLIGGKDKAMVRQLIAQPTDEMTMQAVADAEYATFQRRTDLTQAIGGVRTAINKRTFGVGGDILFPFTQTPTNVAATVVDYTPIGFARSAEATLKLYKLVRKDAPAAELRAMQKMASERFGRAAIGTLPILVGYKLAEKGLATGARPGNRSEGQENDLEGREENAVLVNGTWRSVARLSPMGNLIALGANLYEIEHNPELDQLKKLGGAAASVGTTLLESPFLQGADQLQEALKDPAGAGGRYLSGLAGSVVPAGVRAVARGVDPTIRETEVPDNGDMGLTEKALRGAANQVRAGLPVASKGLPPKRNQFGMEKTRTGGVASQLMDFTRPTADQRQNDPVIAELARTGAVVSQLGRKKGEPIQDYEQRQAIVGSQLYEMLAQKILSDDYQGLPIDEQKDELEKVVRRVRYLAARYGADGEE